MMRLIKETNNMKSYIQETLNINFTHPLIQSKINELYKDCHNDIDRVQKAFEFVRDEISHSWDIQSTRITKTASDVLKYGEGICYAKSNLLAALLRGVGIPVGFCYQRLTLGDTPDSGYCIHALNGIYIKELDKWIRLDARGNKEGVDAQFSLDKEKLAFPIREFYDEVDYDVIFKNPNKLTMNVLNEYKDCVVMYQNGLPSALE